MSDEKLAIKIIPTPASQDLSEPDLMRLARITKLPEAKLQDRLSRGKSIVIITPNHPKVAELTTLIRSFGFSVKVGPAGQPQPIPIQPTVNRPSSTGKHSEESEWRVGDVIENLYEVQDIKQGGMGAVYLVHHRKLNIMMAIKSLLHKLRESEEDRSLFVKEAETWIDIGFHPNIAACYYVRSIDNSPRIFIEYVDGGGLHEWLVRKRHVGWELIIDLMVQVSDGLHHAHSKGLVHRDVKPANCMMSKRGVLKVTDFGLTKRRNLDSFTGEFKDPGETLNIERESVTAAGMGTPGYMAPEMWIPYSEVGPGADIYAFGVMFFEIICGRKPFVLKPGERKDRLALAHVKHAPPSLSSIKKDVPAPIEELVLTCLAKSPEDRFPSFRKIRNKLALVYEELFQKKYAREAPDELKLLSDALNNRAVSLVDLNHHEEAEAFLKKAMASDPHHPETIYNLGVLRWRKTGAPDMDLLLRLEEVTKAPESTARAGGLLGRLHLSMGEAAKAAKAAEASVGVEDVEEANLKTYAIALMGRARYEEAAPYLEKYLEEFPYDEDALGALLCLLCRLGRSDEAENRRNNLPPGSELRNLTLERIGDEFHYADASEVLTLSGHTGWVTAVCHSPLSGFWATTSRDRTVKFWDYATGTEEKTVNVVGEPPCALWVSPTEELLAVGHASASPVKIMDLDTGKFVGNLGMSDGNITALTFSPDGTRALTVEQKGNIRLWNLKETRVAGVFKAPGHTCAAAFFDESGTPGVYVVGMDRLLKRICPLGEPPRVYEKAHKDSVIALKCVPGGEQILTCGRDKQVILWDHRSDGPAAVFQGSEPITDIAINPVRPLVAFCETKFGIKVWDTQTGLVIRQFPVPDELLCLAFSADGARVIAGGKDMSLHVWDVRGRVRAPDLALARILPITKQIKSDRKFKEMIELVKKAVKKGKFSVAYQILRLSQKLEGYERSELALDFITKLKDHGARTGLHAGWQKKSVETGSSVRDVVYSPSAINFLTAHGDHTIRVWSSKTGDCIRILKGHTNLVTALRFSPNSKDIVSGSDDRSVKLWDLTSGRNTLTLKGHTESVSAVAWSPDGATIASGSWDETVRLWKVPEGNALRTLRDGDERITAVGFCNAGEHLISGGFGGAVKMWDTASGRVLRDLKGHKDRITCVDISPQGDLLLSASMDGAVRIWDIRRGMCVLTLDTPATGVRSATFSPDGQFVVTGSVDAVLRIWSLKTGECLREFQGHSKEITSVDFAPNGRFVISSSLDGGVLIWELDWEWEFPDNKTAVTG